MDMYYRVRVITGGSESCSVSNDYEFKQLTQAEKFAKKEDKRLRKDSEEHPNHWYRVKLYDGAALLKKYQN